MKDEKDKREVRKKKDVFVRVKSAGCDGGMLDGLRWLVVSVAVRVSGVIRDHQYLISRERVPVGHQTE